MALTDEEEAVAAQLEEFALVVPLQRPLAHAVHLVLDIRVRRVEPIEKWRQRLDARAPPRREAGGAAQECAGLAVARCLQNLLQFLH